MAMSTRNMNGQSNSAVAQQNGQSNGVNVGQVERWASGISGGAIVTYGLLRRDWLGAGMALLGAGLVFRGATGYCSVYQGLGINTSNSAQEQASVPHDKGIKVERVVTIDCPAEQLYQFWRNFENLPHFMHHLKSVTMSDTIHSHWVADAPAGTKVEWDAEIINEKPNQLIAWRSLPGSQIGNAGSVYFTPAPGNRGTEVKVVLEYDPPAGKVGDTVAKMFGASPDQEVREALRHFKEIMEAGEIATTKGQSSGRSKE